MAPGEEPRWHASLAVLGGLGLYIALPERLSPGPGVALPVLEGVLLLALTVVAPRRRPGEAAWLRGLAIALISLIAAANLGSLALLLQELVAGTIHNGSQLLLSALSIWTTNVIVFALGFWELDRGGPHRRASLDPGADGALRLETRLRGLPLRRLHERQCLQPDRCHAADAQSEVPHARAIALVAGDRRTRHRARRERPALTPRRDARSPADPARVQRAASQ